jgi:5-methylcytosine-specific restriction endonuclease McrA
MKGVVIMPTMVKVQCSVCNKNYEIELKRYNAKIKEKSAFYCSDECRSRRGSILCKCATCGAEVWRTKSQYNRSQTGNIFCSRSCATKLNNKLFKSGENHPNFKGTDYRTLALNTYPHYCSVCGYNEDERLLEVHHIDENHNNNDINNLILLCPMCHRKITLHYYKLVDRNKLELI